MSHWQLCVSMQFKILKEFQKNSKRIPIEFPKNSQRICKKFQKLRTPQPYIPKEFPKNSQKISKEFEKKKKKSQKILTRAYRSKSFSSLFFFVFSSGFAVWLRARPLWMVCKYQWSRNDPLPMDPIHFLWAGGRKYSWTRCWLPRPERQKVHHGFRSCWWKGWCPYRTEISCF